MAITGSDRIHPNMDPSDVAEIGRLADAARHRQPSATAELPRSARILFLLGGAFLLGALVPRLPLGRPASAEIRHDAETVWRDDHQRSPVPADCPRGARTLLILGQSNAANYGEGRRRSAKAVNFYNGRCYRARDPLLGGSGDRGSAWTRLADRLDGPTVLAPIAIGGSRIKEWSPGGRLFPRVQLALMQLEAAAIPPTHILIVQGESEGNSREDPKAYEQEAARLLAYLKRTGAAVYLATATRCLDAPNQEIRTAQARARDRTGTLAGPDMDALDNALRVNGCHFSAHGLDRAAAAWANLISG
jgi:hypothetical protein